MPLVNTQSVIFTDPATHSVGGQTSNGNWRRLSSSVTRRICNITHQVAARDGGPVLLCPVRA